MADLNAARARQEIRDLISIFQGRRAAHDPRIAKLKRGKLYELFVLAWLLSEIRGRGFIITLHGTVLSLKQSPGAIQPNDSYFEISHPASHQRFRIYTDIEVRTLGSSIVPTTDLSGYHEIDIVVVKDSAIGRPQYNQLALGVECKSNFKFKKSILKEALGIKREISYFQDIKSPSILAKAALAYQPEVPSFPESEYFVCYFDSDGNRYTESPAAFGIEFKLLKP